MIVQNTGVHSRQDRRGEYYYIVEDRILDKLLQRDGLEQATQLFLGRTYRQPHAGAVSHISSTQPTPGLSHLEKFLPLELGIIGSEGLLGKVTPLRTTLHAKVNQQSPCRECGTQEGLSWKNMVGWVGLLVDVELSGAQCPIYHWQSMNVG